jgi:hypothetical protein
MKLSALSVVRVLKRRRRQRGREGGEVGGMGAESGGEEGRRAGTKRRMAGIGTENGRGGEMESGARTLKRTMRGETGGINAVGGPHATKRIHTRGTADGPDDRALARLKTLDLHHRG